MLFGNAVQISPTWRARTAFGPFRAYEALGRARVKMAKRKPGRNQPVDQLGSLVADVSEPSRISKVPSL